MFEFRSKQVKLKDLDPIRSNGRLRLEEQLEEMCGTDYDRFLIEVKSAGLFPFSVLGLTAAPRNDRPGFGHIL
jgi:hypothetical protein